MRALVLILAAPLLAARSQSPPVMQPPDSALAAAQRAADAARRRTTRLFADTTPLELTLTANFARVFRNRDTLSTQRFPATLTVADTSGAPTTITVEIAPRGHFRLDRKNCEFPPIKITFVDTSARGTPFQGQNGIKLGTHCRPDSKEYEEYIVREYVVYRIHNLVSDVSLRARLARVTYVGDKPGSKPYTTLGLLIEDDDDAAKRNGGRIAELRGGTFAEVDAEQIRLIGVFEYLIANTDWSMYALHNIRLIQAPGGRTIPLAYDFDHAGIVSARYARPDYRLPIKTVQERLYQGPCLSAGELAPVFAKFTAQRGAIEATYAGTPGLSAGYRKWARDFVSDFFETIGDPRKVRDRIIEACPRDGR
jgi:hypothetical protein